MNYRTQAPDVQMLPPADPLGEPDRVAAYLRCLLALGQSCAADVNPGDLQRAVAGLIVEQCADVSAAAVYRVESGARRASLRASAGAPVSPLLHAVDLDPPGEWPRPELAAALRGDLSHAIVVALEPAPGAPVLGWLRLEVHDAGTASRGLFALGAAQVLAVALARADAQAHERLRSEALVRREEAVSLYLGDVSNEIRTPLTLLLGPLEAAVERRGDTSLAMALRHGYRLRRLVDALLDCRSSMPAASIRCCSPSTSAR